MINLIKKIYVLFFMVLILSFFDTTYAGVYNVTLNPSETLYSDPYKIKNNTSVKIYAPFSDNLGKVTNNFSGGKSFSFGTNLDRNYTHGGFTISNASYNWVTGSRGSCSKSCGGGIKYRSVVCKREDGNTVSNSYCSGTKPSNSTSCNTHTCYTYSWITGSRGVCSGGTKTRSVSCRRSDGANVSTSYCSGAAPASSTSCTSYTYSWYTGTWGTCIKTTTTPEFYIKTRFRTVYCRRSDGASVSDGNCSGTKPATSEMCEIYFYPCFTENQLVSTPTGDVPISKIKIGDTIISYDHKLKQKVTSIVGEVFVHDGDKYPLSNYDRNPLVKAKFLTSKGISETEVTLNHPYYDTTTIDSYKQIRYFNSGDKVLLEDEIGIFLHYEIMIDGNSSIKDKQTIVYNLEMSEGPHNFYVNGILVHNGVHNGQMWKD